MKKNILFIISMILIFTISGNVYAATSTPKPANSENSNQEKNSANENTEEQIDSLKERIASKVAQLKLVEKRGAIGSVIEVADTLITISDLDGNTKYIDLDELTKFSSASISNFGISDIKKGMQISAIGLFNKQSKKVLAREVNQVTIPKFIYGIAIKIDSENNSFTLKTEKEEFLVDVETSTKTYVYSEELETSGFSKISSPENIYVFGYSDKKDSKKIIASRIIRFPDLALNPNISVPKITELPQESIMPTKKPAPDETEE